MNSPAPTFDAEQARLAAAAHLQPAHFVEFQRLAKSLIHGPQFQLLIVDCRDERLRAKVLESLALIQQQAGLRGAELVLDDSVGDVQALEARLVALAAEHEVIHVLGANHWMDAGRWESFNLLRERLSTVARVRLLFWLKSESISLVAKHAPDVWAWRSGIYVFELNGLILEKADWLAHARLSANQMAKSFDVRSMRECFQRIAQLRSLLAAIPQAADDIRVPLLDELATLLTRFGDTEGALKIRIEEQLPLYKKLGNLRLQVVVLSRIADIFRIRGNLEEALRICQEDILPVYAILGDERGRALTLDLIADILQAQGKFSDSLNIRIGETLPVYRRLGDLRTSAVVMGKVADVLYECGDIEESMRIRLEDELPVYDQLGDLRERAVAMGKIADVLYDRGEIDEALRMQREDVLPVFEKLGDVRSLLIGQANLAVLLAKRGRPSDEQEMSDLLHRSYLKAKILGMPEANNISELHKEIVGFDVGSEEE
ncbi:tetratricopeptide repeat protein [Sphaerotilus montanus]|uniref:tetratricopeptide repeat protein n=1 Tax=Sphaerotilus montanus TaxID=522889 RepID=UPI003FA297A4